MKYYIKEIFYSLQGEGRNSGRPAIFCRFSGCNLWNGLEKDRQKATCTFCDTDFVGTDGIGGGIFDSPESLAENLLKYWPSGVNAITPFVICTGGEPLLQLNQKLVDALHEKGFYIAIETNGTLMPPEGVDWICVSPKMGADLVLKKGDELKLVYPQKGFDPKQFESLDFSHFYIQPMDGEERQKNTELAVSYCMQNPKWKLSLQTHKFLGIR